MSELPKNSITIEVKRMWDGGPLRQWAPQRPLHAGSTWVFYSGVIGGYVGPYVCDQCEQPVVGVYRVYHVKKWICKACYELIRSPRKRKKA